MVVVSVVTAECCECVVEGGRVLADVDPAWLETVIPKQPPMLVMVVRGQHNGQVGSLFPPGAPLTTFLHVMNDGR